MASMHNPIAIRNFATAGKAHITLQSKKTGTHFTYRFSAPKQGGDVRFVSVLVAPEIYSYIGVIDVNFGSFRQTAKSKIGADAPSVRAARFFCEKVLVNHEFPDDLEVRHDGKCGRCRRQLTHPESIDRGIGPECYGKAVGA